MGSVDVLTFGCRLNTLESEAMRVAALTAGHSDLIIVNTCAVTAEAVRQARQGIRRAARERPETRIVVTGCAAQTEPQIFAVMPEVATVMGNDGKDTPATWVGLLDFGATNTERVRVNDIMAVRNTVPHLAAGFDGRSRAYVQVQNGCDHRCTFCIIPYGRGNSRSVPMGEVVAQVRRVAEGGYREVVLTGVDVTSYGADLPGTPRLGTLVKAILRHVPELPRLRLSSIDSIEADRDLLDALALESRFMPHLHLSLQAGDTLTLKRMKRRHTREDAIAFCDTVRQLRPDVVLGGDIIAGFPTEDEAMFSRSLDLVDECGLTHLHVFPYSRRDGTPAARMPEVAGSAIKERAARLRAKGAERLRAHCAEQVGRRHAVLTERGDLGRTPGFTTVRLPKGTPHGQILDMTITGHDGQRLEGVS
jgi:threonylcarbamoyladenosine tRNA methylthiotransferase MtaB